MRSSFLAKVSAGIPGEEFISPCVKALPPSGIRKFFDLAAATKDVLSLGVGEPDFVTPWHIREACFYALERGYTMYTSNYGMLELREEIAAHLARRFHVNYDPQREILVTVGASEAIDLALRAVISPGDEVLIPEPSYVSYKPCTILAGGKPVVIPTSAAEGFKLFPEQVLSALTSRSKVLILPYPNNPTGAIMGREDLLKLAQVVSAHRLLVISDEIYSELTYNHEGHVSFASLPKMKDQTILINGFSKAFAMTGWRVGYAAAPAPLINALVKIHQYTALCAPITGQMAALEALRHGEQEVTKMVNEYNQRRRFVIKRLHEIGLDCFEPQGAFYVFPSITSTGLTDEEFCRLLLQEEKVAVVPGTAFGESGAGHVRCSYATSFAKLAEALDRLERFLERHQQ